MFCRMIPSRVRCNQVFSNGNLIGRTDWFTDNKLSHYTCYSRTGKTRYDAELPCTTADNSLFERPSIASDSSGDAYNSICVQAGEEGGRMSVGIWRLLDDTTSVLMPLHPATATNNQWESELAAAAQVIHDLNPTVEDWRMIDNRWDTCFLPSALHGVCLACLWCQ